MQEDFKVSITGDISGLKKAVDGAEKELSDFATKSKALKTAIAENTAITRGYDRAIEDLKRAFKSGKITQEEFKESLNRLKRDEKETAIETKKLKLELINLNRAQAGLPKVAPKVGKGLNTIKKGAANATPTMIEFSRVIQDAPYGIQGVANNITQLVTNFGYLQKSAGGSKAAIKGLLASLAGPTGIIVGISLVTSLLVQYGDKLFKTSTEAEKLAKKQEKLNKSLEEFEKTLGVVNKSQLEAGRSSADELTTLTLLKSQVDNVNLSNKDRIAAYNELKKKYPSYLSNVTQEDALIGGLDEKYDELSSAILKKAKAQAAAELISKNYQKILLLQLKLEEDNEKLGFSAIANNIENNKLKAKGALISSSEAEAAQRSQKRYDKALKTAKETANEIIKLQKDTQKLAKEVEEQGGIIPLNFDVPEVRLPVSKIKFDKPPTLEIEPIPEDEIKIFDNLPTSVGNYRNEIAKILLDLKDLVPPDLFGNLTNLSLSQLDELQNKLNETKVVADIFTNAVGSGFNALSNQIVNSLETGNAVIDAIVQSLVSSLAQIASALITQAITEKLLTAQVIATNTAKSNANAVTIATSAAAALGPAGIVALPGLIASQLALVNSTMGAIAAAGSFATGGIVQGGSFVGDKVPAFVNSGEMILNTRQQSNLFSILDGNLRKLGGNNKIEPVEVVGELRGQTILLANKRAEKTNTRFYGRY